MDLKIVLIIKTFFSLKFYIYFFLVATKCKKVDYWFEKPRMKGLDFSLTYKHNYQKFTHLKKTNATNELESIDCY